MLTAYESTNKNSFEFLNHYNKRYMSSLWRRFTHVYRFKKKWKYNGGDVIFSIRGIQTLILDHHGVFLEKLNIEEKENNMKNK